MTHLENFLIRLEDRPFSFAWRAALGLAIPPAFRAVAGSDNGMLVHMVLLLVLLAALRIGAALARLVLPFSDEARAIWKRRRFLAKDYDSYQWQKLFWIGLGMLPHVVTARGLGWGALAILAFCLVGGAIGLVIWRTVDKRKGRLGGLSDVLRSALLLHVAFFWRHRSSRASAGELPIRRSSFPTNG